MTFKKLVQTASGDIWVIPESRWQRGFNDGYELGGQPSGREWPDSYCNGWYCGNAKRIGERQATTEYKAKLLKLGDDNE